MFCSITQCTCMYIKKKKHQSGGGYKSRPSFYRTNYTAHWLNRSNESVLSLVSYVSLAHRNVDGLERTLIQH